jgi:hypothetical protein
MKSQSQYLFRRRYIFYELNIRSTITRVSHRVQAWGELDFMKSLLQRNSIEKGIIRFQRDLDTCMARFNVCLENSALLLLTYGNDWQVTINTELYRTQNEFQTMHERATAELRDLVIRSVGLNPGTNQHRNSEIIRAVSNFTFAHATATHNWDNWAGWSKSGSTEGFTVCLCQHVYTTIRSGRHTFSP